MTTYKQHVFTFLRDFTSDIGQRMCIEVNDTPCFV
nr:MAG TPA: hypothetical protein [Caudoviricetes sp.]